MRMETAEALRSKAAHARRLAKGTYDQLAIDRLNAFADKCEREADALEAQAPPPAASPPTEHVGQQQQQPQPIDPEKKN